LRLLATYLAPMSPNPTSPTYHHTYLIFFFNDTATTQIYTLSLHDALPICTRNKTRDGLIRVRNIRALNGRFNTSITHAIQGSNEIGRAVQQECRDRSRMPSSA